MKLLRFAVGALALASALAPCAAVSQQATLGPKGPITTPVSADPELDHMQELITHLKKIIPTIQDPAAKAAASDNLELWQHMLDRLLLQSKGNNVGTPHHHTEHTVPPAMKQSPKPPQQ